MSSNNTCFLFTHKTFDSLPPLSFVPSPFRKNEEKIKIVPEETATQENESSIIRGAMIIIYCLYRKGN